MFEAELNWFEGRCDIDAAYPNTTGGYIYHVLVRKDQYFIKLHQRGYSEYLLSYQITLNHYLNGRNSHGTKNFQGKNPHKPIAQLFLSALLFYGNFRE